MHRFTNSELLGPSGPMCLVVTATLTPVGNLDRFQPAGFPEIGHVLYKAPRGAGTEDIGIVDSAASMANHLETACFAGPNDTALHSELTGLPHVVCVTDNHYKPGESLDKTNPRTQKVCTTLTEGHRLASDYFLDAYASPEWREATTEKAKGSKGIEKKVPAQWSGTTFRAQLRNEFKILEVEEDKKYFLFPESWWAIYRTIFRYDPNSLVHGVMFAKEQIKISRVLTAHLEAIGAARVGRSGVKFDRLGKTTSGQPIFAVDDTTAKEIRATFVIDLALIRSYGRGDLGLNTDEKKLILELVKWKIHSLLKKAFRYRSGCHLQCIDRTYVFDGKEGELEDVSNQSCIEASNFKNPETHVYYPADRLFKPGKPEEDEPNAEAGDAEPEQE